MQSAGLSYSNLPSLLVTSSKNLDLSTCSWINNVCLILGNYAIPQIKSKNLVLISTKQNPEPWIKTLKPEYIFVLCYKKKHRSQAKHETNSTNKASYPSQTSLHLLPPASNMNKTLVIQTHQSCSFYSLYSALCIFDYH